MIDSHCHLDRDPLYKNINEIIIRSKNYIQAGCFIYILTIFIPLLPSGSFFSDFNSTIFWINFSLMYACNKQTNIFYEQDLKLKTT